MSSSRVLTYTRNRRSRFLAELKEFVRFPSVSADPRRAEDVRRCAAWLGECLCRAGLEQVRVLPTRGHPLVYGHWLHAPSRPTVLIYGHYDVQPADPLNQWHTPPFEATVRDHHLYGRGTCDDKGQLFAHIKAIEACLRTQRRLPVNVRCLFEGEEEIGSPHLHPFIRRNFRGLAADVTVISDTSIPAPDRPAIICGLRGSLSLELSVAGPARDLHAGNFGGAVLNPAQALCGLIAGLHHADGRVAVPGFYDRVRIWSEAEREYMARVGPSDAEILRNAATPAGWGESGYSLYERATIRPALNVNGITSGHQGPGAKGIIPARARAKLDFRLVPDQDPQVILQLLRRHLARTAPAAVRWSLRGLGEARPALIDRSHPALRAAAKAYCRGFGAPPVFLRSGGTIPVVNTLQDVLRSPVVLMGFGLPDAGVHGPNERLYLPNFYHGIETSLAFMQEVASLSLRPHASRRLLTFR